MRHPLDFVEARARAAHDNSPESVRALTDEVFARTILAGASETLRDRVSRNELAFRNGARDGIAENDIVAVFNRHAASPDVPGYLRVSRGQLHAHRQDLRRFVRSYSRSDPDQLEPPASLSPIEAVFVAADLVLQKIYNPSFQMPADAWEMQRERARRQPGPPTAIKPHIEMRTVALGGLAIAIGRGLPDESGPVVDRIHAFLDDAGFAR
jgi:hypothetical protein